MIPPTLIPSLYCVQVFPSTWSTKLSQWPNPPASPLATHHPATRLTFPLNHRWALLSRILSSFGWIKSLCLTAWPTCSVLAAKKSGNNSINQYNDAIGFDREGLPFWAGPAFGVCKHVTSARKNVWRHPKNACESRLAAANEQALNKYLLLYRQTRASTRVSNVNRRLSIVPAIHFQVTPFSFQTIKKVFPCEHFTLTHPFGLHISCDVRGLVQLPPNLPERLPEGCGMNIFQETVANQCMSSMLHLWLDGTPPGSMFPVAPLLLHPTCVTAGNSWVLVPAVTMEIVATDRIRARGSRQVRLSSPLASARGGRSKFNLDWRHILYAAQITRRTWRRLRVSGT